MSNLPRPLTPLERAILRAVVDLGDEPDEISIVNSNLIVGMPHANIYAAIDGLSAYGYLQRDSKTQYPKVFWRPAFDLTEVLREP